VDTVRDTRPSVRKPQCWVSDTLAAYKCCSTDRRRQLASNLRLLMALSGCSCCNGQNEPLVYPVPLQALLAIELIAALESNSSADQSASAIIQTTAVQSRVLPWETSPWARSPISRALCVVLVPTGAVVTNMASCTKTFDTESSLSRTKKGQQPQWSLAWDSGCTHHSLPRQYQCCVGHTRLCLHMHCISAPR